MNLSVTFLFLLISRYQVAVEIYYSLACISKLYLMRVWDSDDFSCFVKINCESPPMCKAKEKEVFCHSPARRVTHVLTWQGHVKEPHAPACLLVWCASQELRVSPTVHHCEFRNIPWNNEFYSFLHKFHNFFATPFLPVCICHYSWVNPWETSCHLK